MFPKKHKKLSLRFRQWRRKSYAAFQSIGRHVTIGNVKGIVADTLLRKQKEVELFSQGFSWVSIENIFEDDDGPPPEQQSTLYLIPAIQYKKKYCGSAISFDKHFKHKWLKATIHVVFSHFIYSKPIKQTCYFFY